MSATVTEAAVSEAATERLTIEQFEAVHEDYEQRVELVRGKVVVMPRPKQRHALCMTELGFLLQSWAKPLSFYVLTEGGFITTQDTVRGPDFYVVSQDRRNADLDSWQTVPPQLCVEIRSKNDTVKALLEKADEYLAAGVEVVWIVDPFAETIEVLTTGASRIFAAGETTPASGVLPGLTLAINDLFPPA